ncbi:MAG: hypothetical protein M3Y31_03330 [Gemmatimonadota bacterium]|nr:hypothetical protein [Gemmatimonadota bacterium]
MAPALLTALFALAAPLQAQQTDTTAYASPATRRIVERAVARRQEADTAVRDYRAQLRYRLSASLGRRRWARTPTLGVEEQDAVVQWQMPNDLRVDIVGRRSRARSGDGDFRSIFSRPWFVPRSVGDSVRIFSDDFPATGALHPLARGGDRYYTYELVDSARIAQPGVTPLRLYMVEVIPRRVAPALVTGRLWIDSASAEVVRMTFRYVGNQLYVRPGEDGRDSTATRRINTIANRIVTIDADLEYALQDGRHWMPYRQVVSGVVDIPIITDAVVSFEAVTTFDEYEINTGRPVDFTLPEAVAFESDSARREALRAHRDSLRAMRSGEVPDSLMPREYAGRWRGGRYEIHRAPEDSLRAYSGWTDSLTLEPDPELERQIRESREELARLAEDLPDELTGERARGIGFERITDAFRYNRVQGLSLGFGYRLRMPLDFTDLYGTVRYGFSDERLTGRVAIVRDAPGGRLTLAGYRQLDDTDPFVSAGNLAHSVNALFTAHDDADWYLAQGATLELETSVATGIDADLLASVEEHSSVSALATSEVNDFLGGTGEFQPNPAILDGRFGRLGVRLNAVVPFRWRLGVDAIGGEGETTARAWAEVVRSFFGSHGVTLRLRGGAATVPTIPQAAFRIGGPTTVRGFGYGVKVAPAFWAAQMDLTPLGGALRPVFFIDAGQADRAEDIFSSRVLVGGGVGLSIYSRLFRSNLVRFELSRPISDGFGDDWRFDLRFQVPR